MKPKGIVLHLSASTFGDASQIDRWHKTKGWSGIGYHFVVLNGKRNSANAYDPSIDGSVELGRAENIMGAHCKANGMNICTIGICSIGHPNKIINGATPAPSKFVEYKYLTTNQLNTLAKKAAQLCYKYNLDPAATFNHPSTGLSYPVITQHSMHEKGKPECASLNIDRVREAIIKQHKLLLKGVLAELDFVELQEAEVKEDPERIERELPEFQAPLGGVNGPDDLEFDVQLEVSQ